MKISVIVPIYNVNEYLAQCIDSIVSQSYRDLEIILVDDGSTDGSGEICDRYAANDPRVLCIHKANGGLSDARNTGIAAATGDYVMFLDGDDYWNDENAVDSLVQRVQITNAEVVNFSFLKYYEDTHKEAPYFDQIPAMPLTATEKIQQLKYLAENHLYISSACTKMVHRKLFTPELLFAVGEFSEDIPWSAQLIKQAATMDFVCANFYCYRQRSSSISHFIDDKKCLDLCNHIIQCIRLSENDGLEQHLLKEYSAYQYGTFLVVQAQATNWQQSCICQLSRYADILAYHDDKRLVILYWLMKRIGYSNVCRLVRLIYTIKRTIVERNHKK